jgi:signal transduction histidine kinase
MSDGIDQLRRHVNRVLAHQTRPLFLETDERLTLKAWLGQVEHLGLGALVEGQSLAGELAFLATADPGNMQPQTWRFMTLAPERVCHVHVLRLPDGWGVALLDANAEHAEQQARQQSAHEMLLLRDERERLVGELEQANRLKTDFIARMSHEFRTPLASVIGYTDSLREIRQDDREAVYHLDAVARGARYLLNLVENLLDQARIEVDQLTLNPAACDLQEMSDEIEQLLRPVAQQKQLSFAWWFDADIPPRLWIDAARLKQVLINLVGNAIKFTPSGGITVDFGWQDGRLQISVTDTGPGVAEDDAAAIFQPFRQGGERDQAKGAGLGLAISQALVQAMGGEIRLQKSDRSGSTFEFAIDAPTVRGGRSASDSALAGRTLVIADDDPDLLELLKLYLRAAGCNVHAYADASAAQHAVARLRPDAVILDLNLGEHSGQVLAQTLRSKGYRGRIACLSAEPGDTRDSGSAQQPFDAVWEKPFSRGRLLEAVAGLLA